MGRHRKQKAFQQRELSAQQQGGCTAACPQPAAEQDRAGRRRAPRGATAFLPCRHLQASLRVSNRSGTARQSCPRSTERRKGRTRRTPPAPLTPCPELQCRVLMMAPASSIIFSTVPPCTLPAMLASSGRMILRRKRSAAGRSRPAMPRRAAPDAGDVSTWRALPARLRGNRPVPAALGPPPSRRRAPAPSRWQRGSPREQLHPGPVRPHRSAPPRPAPAAHPEGGSRAPTPGGRRHRAPSGAVRRYLDTWMVAGPGPAASRSDMAAPAPASNGAAAAAAAPNREHPPRPAPSPPVRRGRSGRCARGCRAGALRGAALCGGPEGEELRASVAAQRSGCAPRSERARDRPVALGRPSRSSSASRWRRSRCSGFSHTSAAADLALPRPPAAHEAPRRAPALPRFRQLPRTEKPLPGRSRHRGRSPAPPRASLSPGRSLGAPPVPRAGSHRHVEVETLLRCSRSQRRADLPPCPVAGGLIASTCPSVHSPATKLAA